MGFLKKLGKAVSAIIQTALPILIAWKFPEAVINTTAGAVIKHATPISNSKIPVINAITSIGVAYIKHSITTGNWQGSIVPAIHDGLLWMTTSTALHQSIKIPLGNVIGGSLATKVGPGTKFSI